MGRAPGTGPDLAPKCSTSHVGRESPLRPHRKVFSNTPLWPEASHPFPFVAGREERLPRVGLQTALGGVTPWVSPHWVGFG